MKAGCPVCEAQLAPGLAAWHFTCPACRYEMASLEPGINQEDMHAGLDEASRAAALKDLRIQNFRELLRVLKAIKPTGKLLEVGCAHGWFLDQARGTYQTCGIEPDERIAALASARGHSVKVGYFPDTLQPDETFDAIVFNDVFEHLPDAGQAASACLAHLNPGGALLINLPSSSGFFYRLAKLAHRFGLPASFERMWQKGLPSPHLHYFNQANLQTLLQAHGLHSLKAGTLRSIRLKGLYSRISYANHHSPARNLFMSTAVMMLMLVLPFFSADIIYLIAEKPKNPE